MDEALVGSKREVVVFRHGLAVAPEAWESSDDGSRPLTRLGKDKTEQAVNGLLKLVECPQMIVSSPYVRAIETAEIVANAFGFSRKRILVSDRFVPDGDPGESLAFVESLSAARLVVVGHNPNLSRMVALAVGLHPESGISLRKAGAALVRKPGADGRQTWHLQWYVTARLLRLVGCGTP